MEGAASDERDCVVDDVFDRARRRYHKDRRWRRWTHLLDDLHHPRPVGGISALLLLGAAKMADGWHVDRRYDFKRWRHRIELRNQGMANRDRQVRMYDLHSWSGMVLGLFVYVVSFTGCFALFQSELASWEDPAGRLIAAEEPITINETFSNWVNEKTTMGPVTLLTLSYPSEIQPYYEARAIIRLEDGEIQDNLQRWSSEDGTSVAVGRNDLSTWLYDFHRDLMWPDHLGGRQVGLILVGLAGIVATLAIISGIIAHTKIMQEFYTLRYNRSARLKWQDTHNTIGLWGLPFFIMIAVTGAVLGLLRIFIALAAVTVFEGDQQALFQEIAPQAFTRPAGIEAPMLSVDEAARFVHPEYGSYPQSVRIEHWGDENARYNLEYAPVDQLEEFNLIAINGVTGEIQPEVSEAFQEPAIRVQLAINALHYGTFGGIWLKLLYFVLGLLLSLIIALGSMMWLERRLHGNVGRRSEGFYRALSRITIGTTLGFPLATAVIFHADKLVISGFGSQIAMIGWIYFGAVAAAMLFAFLRRNDYRANVELLGLIGLLCLTLPLTNFVVTSDVFFQDLLGATKAYAVIDLIAVSIGAGLLFAAAKLPRARPAGKRAATRTSASRPADVVPQQNRI